MWSNPKQVIWRSERHRRNVATLPCCVCGYEATSDSPYKSQAAHLGHTGDGKGLSLKVPDSRCVPLCPDRPGYIGCHTKMDRYHEPFCNFNKDAMVVETITELLKRGLLRPQR